MTLLLSQMRKKCPTLLLLDTVGSPKDGRNHGQAASRSSNQGRRWWQEIISQHKPRSGAAACKVQCVLQTVERVDCGVENTLSIHARHRQESFRGTSVCRSSTVRKLPLVVKIAGFFFENLATRSSSFLFLPWNSGRSTCCRFGNGFSLV